MRLRAQFLRTVHPYGAFMLASPAALGKVSAFFDQRLDQGSDCLVELDTVRSDPEHAHYFAVVQNSFDNLPEDMADDFLSSDHLRKWALVKAGYCTKTIAICKSRNEARRMAAALHDYDEFVVTIVEKRIVTAYRARSQSYDTMSKAMFQQSKRDVLDVLSRLLGVSVDELPRSKPHGKTEHHRPVHRAGLHDRPDAEIPREPDQRPADETERG
jgi:hypothetical protein